MKTKKVFKSLMVVLLGVASLSSCANNNIEGAWVEPVPGMPDMQQGFVLETGGKASSINMATLQYETWKQQDNQLILSGKSIGNHQTFSFADTLVIEKITSDSLILKQGEQTLKYSKRDKK